MLDTGSEDALWRSVYLIAGMCHWSPDQLAGLLADAREALGAMGAPPPPPDWPAVPSMRDIFDHAIHRNAVDLLETDAVAAPAPARDGTILAVALDDFKPLAFPDGWMPLGGEAAAAGQPSPIIMASISSSPLPSPQTTGG